MDSNLKTLQQYPVAPHRPPQSWHYHNPDMPHDLKPIDKILRHGFGKRSFS